MSKTEAHIILTTAKEGGLVPSALITEALIATGDLSAWRATQSPYYLPSSVEAQEATA